MAIRDRIVGAGRSALRAADSYLASVSPDAGDSPVLDVDLDEPLVRGETGNTTSGSGDATPIKNGSKPAQFELPSPTSDDPRALYWDPFSVVEQLGYKDKPTAMTYNTLRTIMWRVPIIRAIIQTRVNQVAAFAIPQRNRFDPGFRVKLRDPAQRATRAARKFEAELEAMIMQSGVRSDARYRDNFEQFLRKFVLDSLSLDQACAEILYGRNGKPAEWYAVDAATIRLADMRKLSPDLDPAAIKTVQVYDNVIINEFRADEMMFCIRNPRTDTRSYGYGTSEIEMLMSTVTSILYAWNYNQNFFQQGSVAKGFLNIRGNMPERQLKQFRRQWYQQLASVANAWRTPILSAEKGVDWHNMQSSNRDMEFSAWMDFLIKVACFAPTTKVVMGDGTHKEICAVAPGDLVRTHAGRLRPVKNVQSRPYAGEMIRVRASGREVLATPEHPFEIVSSRVDGHMRREFEDPRYERADAIVPGNDFLVVPKPVPLAVTCARIDLGAYVDPEMDDVLDTSIKPKANRSTAIPRFIDLSDENAFALGLYLAEGCGCRSRSGVSFSFHRDETEYVAAARAFFARLGLESSVVDLAPKLGVKVLAHSISLARAVHGLFGHKALNKRIPAEIRNGPLSARRAFISGFLAGDGCVWEARIRDSRTMTANIASTSDAAAEAVQGMLLEQGIYAGRYRSSARTKRNSVLWQVVVGGSELKKLSQWLSGPKGDKLRALIAARDGYTRRAVYETSTRFYVPVTEVSREPYDGMVFNLEVEEDHTYQVENFAVHNCSVFAMDPIEVNFKYGSSNARSMFDTGNKSKTTESKDRGLRPLLRFISRELDRYIIHPIDEDFTLEFVGLDSSTPKELADLNTQRVRSMFTIDEIRIENDLPPLPEGSGEVILDSNWLAYRRELLAREQQKRQQAEAVAAAAASATSLTDAALGGGMPGAQVVPGGGAVIDTPPQQAGATAIAAKPAASGHAPGAIPGRGGGAGESAEPQGPDKDQIAELEGLLNPSRTSSMTKSTSETIEIIDL